jgi:hypothetical protein
MLLCQQIKMVFSYVKIKKCFRRYLGFSRHFDFWLGNIVFIFFIVSEQKIYDDLNGVVVSNADW